MAALPRVFASRKLPGSALERLARQVDLTVWPGTEGPAPEALRRAAHDAEGLLCLLTDRIDRPLLDACPRLRVISTCSAGVDHVDLAAVGERGIALGHTPGVLSETTADLAFALLLAAGRRIPEADRFVRSGQWTSERRWAPEMLLGRDLWGATLGIVGLGEIGAAVARRAGGFGMRILGWSRSPREVPGAEWVGELDTLLSESDFVTIHLPLTEQTRGLLGPERLERLKPGAVVVNTARGGILDEDALAAALRSGRVSAAGLDVFEEEPLSPSSPLRSFDSVVLLPHIGSASVATRSRMADVSVENLLAGLAGMPLPSAVPGLAGPGEPSARGR
jgi:glyoxylate reductase